MSPLTAEVLSSLLDSDLVPQLSRLLTSMDNPPEILSNAIVLVETLCSSDLGKNQFLYLTSLAESETETRFSGSLTNTC